MGSLALTALADRSPPYPLKLNGEAGAVRSRIA
jgi:hypothetical protein